MVMMLPSKSFYYALITSIGSMLGGVFGYFLGVRAGRPLLIRFVKGRNFDRLEGMFRRYGGWAVAIAGFTPIPYKVFTIAAGVFRIDLITFFIAVLLSRSARFFLEAALVVSMGEKAPELIDRILGPGSFLVVASIAVVYLAFKNRKSCFLCKFKKPEE